MEAEAEQNKKVQQQQLSNIQDGNAFLSGDEDEIERPTIEQYEITRRFHELGRRIKRSWDKKRDPGLKIGFGVTLAVVIFLFYSIAGTALVYNTSEVNDMSPSQKFERLNNLLSSFSTTVVNNYGIFFLVWHWRSFFFSIIRYCFCCHCMSSWRSTLFCECLTCKSCKENCCLEERRRKQTSLFPLPHQRVSVMYPDGLNTKGIFTIVVMTKVNSFL